MSQSYQQQQVTGVRDATLNSQQTRGNGSSSIMIDPVGRPPQQQPGEKFDTLLNSIFSSTTQSECNQINALNICGHKELPCFFEFLQSCSPRREEDLVYGIHCLRHLHATNRTVITMATQSSVDLQPMFMKTASCEKNIFLWSFLTNLSYPQAKELISFMNIGTAESSNLAKFMMAVSEPYGRRQNSEEYQRLYQYLSAYCQNAISCIETIPDRDKILIPVIMTNKFREDNSQNRLISDISDKIAKKELSFQKINDSTHQVFIPLKYFNILDQINLLSFRIYCGIGRISLAPNVSVTCERVYIGSGLSIRNTVSTLDISKMRSVMPDTIYRIVKSIHGTNVHSNYDVLVLLAVPVSTCSSISPQIFLAKRKFLTSSFDIDKLDVVSFC